MKTELKIEGMHCNSCSAMIREELKDLPGIASADVSLNDKRAVIEFDENAVKQETIIETIKSLGFTVTA